MDRISPTFIDSFLYYLSIEDDDRSATVREELLSRLKGVKVPPNEAMQAGIDFENNVVLATRNKYLPESEGYDNCVFEIADIVKGSIFQHHVESETDGVLVHGYIDCLKHNHAFDIKTTKKYKVGKYLKKNQHLVYLYCLRQQQISKFTYLITDLKNVYAEDYYWQDSFLGDLKSNIAKWYDYLEVDDEMKQAFIAKQLQGPVKA